MAEPGHIPVLLEEVVAALDPRPGQTLVDCTAGLGGHAAAIARTLGPTGRVVLVDLDPGNLARATAAVRAAMDQAPASASGEIAPEHQTAGKTASAGRDTEDTQDRVVAIRGSFAWVGRELAERGIVADMLLADLGFASSQMDDPQRGFSFRRPGPLDMRLDPASPLTAADLVNQMPEEDLAELIARCGEDRLSRRIARAIVQARADKPIHTTDRLASIVERAYPPPARHGQIHPATRTFQALRIAVNDELGSLESLLASITRQAAGPTWLARGARIAIISFHSLEDRPIKHAFRAIADANRAQLINRKPIVAGDEEIACNPRARSAKLRALKLAVDV